MQDLPPPPTYECVAGDAAGDGVSYVVVAGDPMQVAALVEEAKAFPRWSVEAAATAGNVRFVRLKASIDVPYKDVGGLIYRAQLRHLSVSFNTDPLICTVEEK